MEQSILIELIRTLRPEEKEQIIQFATLSMFNSGRMRAQVLPLLKVCLNHQWEMIEQKLEKSEVFASIFPGQEFIEGKLEKVMVDAHKVVRSFLLTQYYFREENEFHQVLDFSEIVRVRGLNARYQQLLVKLQKIQKEYPWENAHFFHHQYLLEYAIHVDDCYHNKVKGDLNVPNSLQALERYYQHNRLSLLNNFLLQQKATNLVTPYSISIQLEANHAPEPYLEESPSIKISNEILALLRKRDPTPLDVNNLRQLLQIHEKALDNESLRKFYAYLRNICVLVLNIHIDNEDIRLTLHELYKDNLQRGYLKYEGRIHSSLYLSVSLLAIQVKQFDWALEFIENNKNEIIGENENQDLYRFNKANYLFGIGKFSDCLDLIPASSPYVNYLLHGKRLELKTLFELQSDLLAFKLDAFKMFLSRTSQKLLPEYQRQLNVDFANLLTQIICSIPGDHKRAERLIARIKEKKQVHEWRWLLSKATAIKIKTR